MKIIRVDNYNRDGIDDVLICENIANSKAQYIVKLLNKDPNRDDYYWYKVVPDDYELYQYEV